MTVATAQARREHVPKGIIYMVAATVAFAVSTAITKWELSVVPMGEVAFTRQLFSLLFCAAIILPVTGLSVFKTYRLGQHTVRSVSQFTSQMCLLAALLYLPLGSVTAVSFSSGLFAALFSVIFLGERIGIHRAVALVTGFCGVLLVTNPGHATFGPGVFFALANAILYGSVTVGVRKMGATESPETLTMYQMTMLTVLMSLLLPFGVTMPPLVDAGLLAVCGLLNGIGQYWWTQSLNYAPASAVMPFYYIYIVWTMVMGYLIWGEIPTAMLLVGAAIVVASGMYLAWRESLARRQALALKKSMPVRGG